MLILIGNLLVFMPICICTSMRDHMTTEYSSLEYRAED